VLDAETPEAMQAAIDERKANTPAGAAKRAALVEAMDLKHYEFNAHGVDMGQFYESAAVVPDGSPKPLDERDPELYYKQSTVPGARFPHVWVADVDGHKRSTHDLVPYGQFTLVTGIAGEAWADAATKVAEELGVPLEAVVIGPGREVIDTYYDWAKMRGVEESGAILVRPDAHVAWRAPILADDPARALGHALRAVLGRSERDA
jgi:2,4-dichlorophenol 6-monooxygenase